jgi:hypothetical protein
MPHAAAFGEVICDVAGRLATWGATLQGFRKEFTSKSAQNLVKLQSFTFNAGMSEGYSSSTKAKPSRLKPTGLSWKDGRRRSRGEIGGPPRTCSHVETYGANLSKSNLWAVKPACMQPQARVEREIPCFTAITAVAPGVRFNFLAIFLTPRFFLAIDFSFFRSSLDQARRTTFLFFVANFVSSFLWDRAFSTRSYFINTVKLREGHSSSTVARRMHLNEER